MAPPNNCGSRAVPSFLVASSAGPGYCLGLWSYAHTSPYSSIPPLLPPHTIPNQYPSIVLTGMFFQPALHAKQGILCHPLIYACRTNLAHWVLREIPWVLTKSGFFTFKKHAWTSNRDNIKENPFIRSFNMFILYLLELNFTANKNAVLSGLTELIIPERHRHVNRQL